MLARFANNIYAVLALMATLGFGIYAVSLNNGFVLDDELQIISNEVIRSPSNIRVFFSASTFNQENAKSMGGIYFKPLMSLAYSILWWLNPGEPAQFHWFQLTLVILNAFLVFLLFSHFMHRPLALLAALIFLAHPINTEVAVYIADLQDVMFTFFGLLALNLLLRWDSMSASRVGILALVLVCSVLSKETGLLYVLVCLLYGSLFRRQMFKPLAFAVVMALAFYFWLRLGVAHLNQLTYAMNKIGAAGLSVRLLTAPLALATYFVNFFYPLHFSSTQDWVVEEATWLQFWLPLIAMSATVTCAIWYSRYRWNLPKDSRWFGFFTCWVIMGMGLHSHIIVPLDGTFADRWFYFPCIGWMAMLCILLEQWAAARPALVRALPVVAILGLAGLSARSFFRAQNWRDQYTLCKHDLLILPLAYDLHNCLGVELFRRGQVLEAKEEFERSVQLKPQWEVNWSNLGAAWNHLGDAKKAEEYYLRAINNGPYYTAYENYAELLVAQGRNHEAKEFIEQKALPRFPAGAGILRLYKAVQQH